MGLEADGSVAEGRGGGTACGGHPGTHEPAAPPLVMSAGQGKIGGRTPAPLASCGARPGDPPGLYAPPCPLH